MQCFSCFSDINETYNYFWYPLEYCSKCNLVAIKIDKFESFIDFVIKQNMNIKNDKDLLVYEYVKKTLLKKVQLSTKKFDNRICHSQCSLLNNDKSEGLCRYHFINDKDFNIFYCFLINRTMFNLSIFENFVKKQIKKGYKKWFLIEKIKRALRRN